MKRRTAQVAIGVFLLLASAAPAQGQEEQPVEVNVESIHVPASTGKLVRPGIRVIAGCNLNCLLLVEVRLPASVAGRLGLRKTQIAEAVGDSQAGEATTMYARVKPTVAERLGGYTGRKGLKVDVQSFP